MLSSTLIREFVYTKSTQVCLLACLLARLTISKIDTISLCLCCNLVSFRLGGIKFAQMPPPLAEILFLCGYEKARRNSKIGATTISIKNIPHKKRASERTNEQTNEQGG